VAVVDRAVKNSRTGLLWPLTQGARADSVAKRISRAIQLGLLPDGEQLPAEAEFAAQMGVSPMTLREAFSILRDQGLVETRRGRTGGTFVRRLSQTDVSALWQRLAAISVTELRDLTDGQFAAEGAAAYLAADRAPQMTVRRLFTLVDQMESATTQADLIRADARFHIEVAIASQSERLLRATVELQTESGDLLWTPLEEGFGRADAVADHRAIADAIAAGDGEKARLLAEHHVQRTLGRLIELHRSAGDGVPAFKAKPRRRVEPTIDQLRADAQESLAGLITAVSARLDGFFTSIDALADAFFALQERLDAAPSAHELGRLDDAIRREIARQPMADGLGMVFTPGYIDGHDRHIEWLHRAGDKITPLRLNLDTTSVNVYDYLQMDWYTLARDRNARCVYGPFLDFAGADYYVSTVTAPLMRNGAFYGVAGADIRMSDLERELMSIVSTAPMDTVLLNAEGTVLAANTSRWVVGERLHSAPVAGGPADGGVDADTSERFIAVGQVNDDSRWVLALAPKRSIFG
jgi:DNA-binding FadR family transcriptional regulator